MLVIWVVSGIAGHALLRRLPGINNMPVIVILSVIVALFPFSGLSFSDYLLSLNPNFSIGTVAYFFFVLWKRFVGVPLISDRNLIWFSIWNITVCFFLYASFLGFVDIDLYPLGYGFSVLFIIVALLTVVLLLLRNPLSYVFILYIVFYDFELLVSKNYFDYLVDPLLFFISIGILINLSVSGWKKGGSKRTCWNAGCTGLKE